MIVVTGANGFIGANLVARLAATPRGPVIHVDDYPSIRGAVEPVDPAPVELRQDVFDANR